MARDVHPGRGSLARLCPCGSGRSYRACCAPCHLGHREAPDAVSLMRSRYAAFAVGDAAYLFRTLHMGHADRGRDRDELLRELKATIRRHRYRGLKILDSVENGGTASVLFLARLFEAGADRSFVELSDFLHDGEGWRYLHGIALPRARIGVPPEDLTIARFSSLLG
ncbi:YchJ family metal-binding protein [Sorangium sp. So ce1036]|uniref:YchJ family protein n=1 Tax=Sorangium sp. So ce1036 TaxID=3133328 RepID=UPI003EFFC4B6